MSADRIGVRTGETLRGVVAGYGEITAATKSLLILGAIAAGTPVAALQEDILPLLGSRLTPELRAHLLNLLNLRSIDVEHHPVAADVPLDDADPFEVGIEV